MSVVSLEYINTLPFADGYVRSFGSLGSPLCNTEAEPMYRVIHDSAPGREKLQDSLSTPRALISSHQTIEEALPPAQGSQNEAGPPSYTSNHPCDTRDGSNTSEPSSELQSRHSDDFRTQPLEDYDGIDAALVDRYGFFIQTDDSRRPSSVEHVTKSSGGSLKRKTTLTRQKLKRASINLGLTSSRDYLEAPTTSVHDVNREVKRGQKWTDMARRRPDDASFHFKVTSKLRKRVYKGVPDCWRAAAWSSLLSHNSSAESDHQLRQQYDILVASPCEYDSQIDLDVPRTVSGHVLFRHRHVGGQRLLFRVLHAISLQFPVAGYVQGMASVAAMCLCYYPEDQAFVTLCRLWGERGLSRLYDPGFSTLMTALKDLEHKLARSEVGLHLINIGCLPLAWATRWYLTIFHISVPFHTQLRIWDVFMLHGEQSEVVHFAVLEATTLALIEGIGTILLQSDFDEAMSILTRPVAVMDNDRLISAIWRRLKS